MDLVRSGRVNFIREIDQAFVDADGSLDGPGIAAELPAPLVEHRILVGHGLGGGMSIGLVGESMPDIGVLGDDA